MAIYPTLFTIYLKQMVPWFGEGHYEILGGMVTLNHGLLAACLWS